MKTVWLVQLGPGFDWNQLYLDFNPIVTFFSTKVNSAVHPSKVGK